MTRVEGRMRRNIDKSEKPWDRILPVIFDSMAASTSPNFDSAIVRVRVQFTSVTEEILTLNLWTTAVVDNI
jgi:hypothetical protein